MYLCNKSKKLKKNTKDTIIPFLQREWLFSLAFIGFFGSCFYTQQIASFDIKEFEVLWILFTLFVVVNGFKKHNLLVAIARRIEQGRLIPFKLVFTTFFLATFVTNDVSLIVMVPLTLTLRVSQKGLLVILEVLAANAGSALTPIGNPQNLYLYWYYNIPLDIFFKTIAPFSLFFLFILLGVSFFLKQSKKLQPKKLKISLNSKVYVYFVLFVLIVLIIVHLLPLAFLAVVPLYVVTFDRDVLKVDYFLLLSFLLFFGIADNLQTLLATQIQHSHQTFLLSVFASQILSNVPTTLLFANFTEHYKALLWGVNVGGFGTLFGSLANLIAYKLYVYNKSMKEVMKFTLLFHVMSFLALFLAIGLYYFVTNYQRNIIFFN